MTAARPPIFAGRQALRAKGNSKTKSPAGKPEQVPPTARPSGAVSMISGQGRAASMPVPDLAPADMWPGSSTSVLRGDCHGQDEPVASGTGHIGLVEASAMPDWSRCSPLPWPPRPSRCAPATAATGPGPPRVPRRTPTRRCCSQGPQPPRQSGADHRRCGPGSATHRTCPGWGPGRHEPAPIMRCSGGSQPPCTSRPR
jgi:hypothetical protein